MCRTLSQETEGTIGALQGDTGMLKIWLYYREHTLEINLLQKNYRHFQPSPVTLLKKDIVHSIYCANDSYGAVWSPEDGGTVFLRNVGICLQVHATLQPRRLTLISEKSLICLTPTFFIVTSCKIWTLDHALSQVNAIYISITYCSNILFNITLTRSILILICLPNKLMPLGYS
jgi:hypothetical protein